MQLIEQIDQIFKWKKLHLWLYTYEIIATGPDCGILEFIKDSMSLDAIKKKNNGISLDYFFIGSFKERKQLSRARMNFAESLAAYSLVTYVL